MTNLEAYFRDAEELQQEFHQRDGHEADQRQVKLRKQYQARDRAYSRELLSCGCILFRMIERKELL
jgi:prolyl-tRNA synthetase